MLWDMIYSADRFSTNVTLGRNGYSIKNVKKFLYSFVTVPIIDNSRIKPTSTQLMRVKNLTGGNYWGLPTKSGVAASPKEILSKNFSNGHTQDHLTTLRRELANLKTTYSYFGI